MVKYGQTGEKRPFVQHWIDNGTEHDYNYSKQSAFKILLSGLLSAFLAARAAIGVCHDDDDDESNLWIVAINQTIHVASTSAQLDAFILVFFQM